MDKETKFKIIIADDEEGLRFSLASILEMEDYEVQTAGDGAEALELVKSNDFDIAFFDIRMPGMNGVEALKQIKRLSPETIVVMMTAYAMNDLIKESIKEGAFACISKPFEIEDVLNTVKEVASKPIAFTVTDNNETRDFIEQNLKASEFMSLFGTNAQKALKFIKRRRPELVFLDAKDIDGSFIKELCGMRHSPEIVVIDNDALKTDGVKTMHSPLTKASITEFLKSTGKKKAAIISSDTISSNNLKLAVVAKGYSVSNYTDAEAFFTDPQWDSFDFVITENAASAELDALLVKINESGRKIMLLPLLDFESPVSENLKKQNIAFLQRPFDSQDLFNIMEK